jgi:hypothetical protein
MDSEHKPIKEALYFPNLVWKKNKHPIWRLGVQSGRTLLTHASIPSIRKINKKLKFKKLYWKFFLLLPIK